MAKKYYLACDLKDDPQLIEAYQRHHLPENAWPEITNSIREAGILDMQIFLAGNRLFMVMETEDDFDPNRKAQMDAQNPRVQEWEALMDTYQKRLPFAQGEKWVIMKRIFQL